MTDRAAFVAAIEADPDNDLPRLVWADWLDDHGEPERAELIRVQCAGPVKASTRLTAHDARLLKAIYSRWPADLRFWFNIRTDSNLIHLKRRFVRGCLNGFFMLDAMFTKLAEQFAGVEPFLDIRLCILPPLPNGYMLAEELPAHPQLRAVAELSGVGLGPFIRSTHLRRLSAAEIPAPAELPTLLASWHVTGLRRLTVNDDIGDIPPRGEVGRLLAHTPGLAGLEELDLRRYSRPAVELRELIASPHLSRRLRVRSKVRPGSALARDLAARFPGPTAVS